MTLAARKRCVAGGVALLLCLANLSAVVNWLEKIGVVAWSQHLCDRYVVVPEKDTYVVVG